jgi:hypothetical protein
VTADLSNDDSQLHSRLDVVWARFGNAGYGGQSDVEIVGEDPGDRFTATGGYDLWPSDHAGLFASMWVAPGLLSL